MHGQSTPAASAGGQALQQGAALAQGAAAGLVRVGSGVGGDALLVGFVGGPVDVAKMVVHDQHLPVAAVQPAGAGAQHTVVVEAAFAAGATIDIGASVGRMGEHTVDRRVGGCHPGQFVEGL